MADDLVVNVALPYGLTANGRNRRGVFRMRQAPSVA